MLRRLLIEQTGLDLYSHRPEEGSPRLPSRQKARPKIRNRQLLGSGSLVAFVLIIAFGISQSESGSGSNAGMLMIAFIIALILGLVLLITASPFKAVGHRKGWFKMKGVSQALLDELPQGDWKSL